MFSFTFADSATKALTKLKVSARQAKQYKAVKGALRLLQAIPRHPGLESHKFQGLNGPQGQEVFEACAQQQTPGAYRVFFCYGPGRYVIQILAIIAHPD